MSNSTRIDRPYPRKTLEQALRVPQALKQYNGGKPWPPADVAKTLDLAPKSGNFFYIAGASRDFGLTTGSRDTAEIGLTDLGRKAVYPQSEADEGDARRDAFLSVDIFKRVVEHYGGSELPEATYRANTFEQVFGLDPSIHAEFVELFEKNAKYVGIGADFAVPHRQVLGEPTSSQTASSILVEPSSDESSPVCFIIMPFTERDDRHQSGFFDEVLGQVLGPAATRAGFQVRSAKRPGSDVIQSTIVNELLAADLVLADLTEHNPNVLFELGMRMAEDRPVALVRAKGTGPIFDVDNMLRVEEYNPNLWVTTVERDVPRLQDHIAATWANRESADTFMKILRQRTQ